MLGDPHSKPDRPIRQSSARIHANLRTKDVPGGRAREQGGHVASDVGRAGTRPHSRERVSDETRQRAGNLTDLPEGRDHAAPRDGGTSEGELSRIRTNARGKARGWGRGRASPTVLPGAREFGWRDRRLGGRGMGLLGSDPKSARGRGEDECLSRDGQSSKFTVDRILPGVHGRANPCGLRQRRGWLSSSYSSTHPSLFMGTLASRQASATSASTSGGQRF